MTVPTNIFGDIPIHPWEWTALFFYLVFIFIIAGIVQRRKIDRHPEYKYFNLGLLAKVGGGIGFALIYLFYYEGGDTFSYYETTLAFSNMLGEDPGTFLETFFGEASAENKSKFTTSTGVPYGYIYLNENALFTSKILLPFVLLGLRSYILTTVLISVATFFGLWRLYRMFVSYFPHLKKKLAITVLFLPSVVFWGSGILKDSFTIAAVCYFITSTDHIINKKTEVILNWITFIISAFFILSIKPYIFMIAIPGTMVWLSYKRLQRIRNRLFRYLIVPILYVVILAGSYTVLTTLGDALGRYSLDKAFQMAAVIQEDLQQEYYHGHTFDIGDFEPTPTGVLSKFPIATVSGLYRPFLPEVANLVMLLSALETSILLVLTILPLFRNRISDLFGFLTSNPLLIYCILFSILFAFMIGVTTPNYGALVRFRIPFLPLFASTLMILSDRKAVRDPAFRGRELKQ
ncbi:MAG: hypothetical protein ABEH38_03625 [Flavobacteriales bacterium]